MTALLLAAKRWRKYFQLCESNCGCEDCKLARVIDLYLKLEDDSTPKPYLLSPVRPSDERNTWDARLEEHFRRVLMKDQEP